MSEKLETAKKAIWVRYWAHQIDFFELLIALKNIRMVGGL